VLIPRTDCRKVVLQQKANLRRSSAPDLKGLSRTTEEVAEKRFLLVAILPSGSSRSDLARLTARVELVPFPFVYDSGVFPQPPNSCPSQTYSTQIFSAACQGIRGRALRQRARAESRTQLPTGIFPANRRETAPLIPSINRRSARPRRLRWSTGRACLRRLTG
jgi:hypothetical protein